MAHPIKFSFAIEPIALGWGPGFEVSPGPVIFSLGPLQSGTIGLSDSTSIERLQSKEASIGISWTLGREIDRTPCRLR